jgi:hypothetical protein
LRRHGATAWCLNAGGDVLTSGAQADGRPWVVGIVDPTDRTALISQFTCSAVHPAVATSGVAERGEHIWRAGDVASTSSVTAAPSSPTSPAWLPGSTETAEDRLVQVTVAARTHDRRRPATAILPVAAAPRACPRSLGHRGARVLCRQSSPRPSAPLIEPAARLSASRCQAVRCVGTRSAGRRWPAADQSGPTPPGRYLDDRDRGGGQRGLTGQRLPNSSTAGLSHEDDRARLRQRRTTSATRRRQRCMPPPPRAWSAAGRAAPRRAPSLASLPPVRRPPGRPASRGHQRSRRACGATLGQRPVPVGGIHVPWTSRA